MQYSYQRLLSFLRNAMTILNMLIVVFYGSVILLTTQYIVSTRLARDFFRSDYASSTSAHCCIFLVH